MVGLILNFVSVVQSLLLIGELARSLHLFDLLLSFLLRDVDEVLGALGDIALARFFESVFFLFVLLLGYTMLMSILELFHRAG